MDLATALYKAQTHIAFWPIETAGTEANGFEAAYSLIRRWKTVDDMMCDHAEVPASVQSELLNTNVASLDYRTFRSIMPIMLIAGFNGAPAINEHVSMQLSVLSDSLELAVVHYLPLSDEQRRRVTNYAGPGFSYGSSGGALSHVMEADFPTSRGDLAYVSKMWLDGIVEEVRAAIQLINHIAKDELPSSPYDMIDRTACSIEDSVRILTPLRGFDRNNLTGDVVIRFAQSGYDSYLNVRAIRFFMPSLARLLAFGTDVESRYALDWLYDEFDRRCQERMMELTDLERDLIAFIIDRAYQMRRSVVTDTSAMMKVHDAFIGQQSNWCYSIPRPW